MSRYPDIPLGEVLELDCDVVEVNDTATYQIAGVYGFGRGVFAREPITGLQTKYRTLTRLQAGQLVLSRLKAFEGAVAVVPKEFEGYHVSQEFPTFSIKDDRAEADYLAYVCQWPDFWERLRTQSKGVGARRERVHPADLLSVKIPLPPFSEQQRIVGEMERVLGHQKAAGTLMGRSRRLTEALPAVLSHRPDLPSTAKAAAGWRKTALGEVCWPAVEEHRVEIDRSYPNVGVYSFGRGLFEKEPIDGALTKAKTLYRIRAGRFIYSRLFAFEGAYAAVDERFDGYFVSNEFPVFDLDEGRLDVRFLAAYFTSPAVWAELSASSKGLGLRRQRVHPERLLAHRIWLPPLDEQRAIGRTLDRVRRIGELRTVMRERLSALEASVLNRAFAGQL